MATTTVKTDAQLEAEIQRLETQQRALAEQQAQRARQAQAALDDAQSRWRRDVLAKAPALEDDLDAEHRAHLDTARAALTTGDLNAAYQAWIGATRALYVRAEVRTQAQSAAQALAMAPYNGATLNVDRGTFVDFLTREHHHVVEHGLTERVEDLLGVLPTD